MGKLKSLISDTLLFAAATFSSKLLTFLLLPLLTTILAPGEYSAATNAIYTANFILPVMYLSISEAVIRFGLDPAVNRRDIFTAGILTVLGGFAVMQLVLPLVMETHFMNILIGGDDSESAAVVKYESLVRIFILSSAMRTVVTHFVRSSGLKRVFAMDGLMTTVMTLVFAYIFLVPLKLGGQGYMLATICADTFSALGMILLLRLHRFFRLKGLDFGLWNHMLAYSAPLVPTAIFWWVTNLSDRFFLTATWGNAVNGLYDAAGKLPMVITMVSSVFTSAWQISAFSDQDPAERERFFSTVFRSYYTFVFIAASGVIMVIRPVTRIIMSASYYESWRYAPFLVLAVSFSCFVTFLGTVYNAAKKNIMVTVTTAFGAVLNLILNWLLIPPYGAQGASIATFASYGLVFIFRAADTRKYIKIRMQPLRIAASLALLVAQAWISLSQPSFGMLLQILIFTLLTLCNLGYVIFAARRILALAAARKKRPVRGRRTGQRRQR